MDDALEPLRGPVRDWFLRTFPEGPTPIQASAWPAVVAGENALLISPTGSGKTLAAFLAILARLIDEPSKKTLETGPRVIYLSPLKSLGNDIDRNLKSPLAGISTKPDEIRVGVRTGDTSASSREKLRDHPPHILITTPESLSILLAQADWNSKWIDVETLVIDEVHSLIGDKRGADLAVSLERLAAKARRDPSRIGLSATCRPPELAARYLVGPSRDCRVIEAPPPRGGREPRIEIESLIREGEAPHRALSYRRLLRRIRGEVAGHRSTIVFANTRAFTEKLTRDLRRTREFADAPETAAAHHSSLDADRRREVEVAMKEGRLRVIVTSTSLELGIDIGAIDSSILVGLPGSVSRCVQRVGRAGHRPGAVANGVILASNPAELFGAVVTAERARKGEVESLRGSSVPLDVVCQQLVGMACAGETSADDAFRLFMKASSTSNLKRCDFDACLDFLAGELSAPATAEESDEGSAVRTTAPRLWKRSGRFGVRSRRVIRLLLTNVGTILSEESLTVMVDDSPIGSIEATYAERLSEGDRFVLDGRTLTFKRIHERFVHAEQGGDDGNLPSWSSERQSLSRELALETARFRSDAARLNAIDPIALRAWLIEGKSLSANAAAVIAEAIELQERFSEAPAPDVLLVEESPADEIETFEYAFHAPLSRSGCDAVARAMTARLGRRFGKDVGLRTADLGWSIRLPEGERLDPDELGPLISLDRFEEDVLDGLERGELLARRFRRVAATALMVLKNPDGKRTKVGGLQWVSRRLYPLIKACAPNHPLLRETRRVALEEILDAEEARAFLAKPPELRFRRLDQTSPFTRAWIVGGTESIRYESSGQALKRLHARLFQGAESDPR